MKCGKCGGELGPTSRRRAFISLFAQGDEEILSWYFCEGCRFWTIEVYYDHFMGDSEIRQRGPYPEFDTDQRVGNLANCGLLPSSETAMRTAEQLAQQLLFGSEIPVENPFANPHLTDDVAH